jgi:hypothetical protein
MPHVTLRRSAVLLLPLAALLLSTCGGGDSAPPPTAPAPPAAPPAAAPTPQPPLSASCERMPLGSVKHSCQQTSPAFGSEVLGAVDTLKDEQPQLFDGETILNSAAYYVGLIRILDRKGLCAAYDGHELAVKETNDFSEQWRLDHSWGTIRRSYMTTCYPAVFPLEKRTPGAPPAGCSIGASVEAVCGDPGPTFLGEVSDAITTLIQQKPELFDMTQTAGGGEWPLLRDSKAYHEALIAQLATRGFCGIFDGEEIVIKRSNDYSEVYDVNYQDRYVRRGPGTYRGTCYPAAF